jgi:hypothetical protein
VFWLDEDRGRLAPAQRHRRFVDPHRDRVTAKQALMQDLDSGAFDKSEFDQPPFQFSSRETVVANLDAHHPDLPGRPNGGSAERHGVWHFTWSNARALSHALAARYCDSLSVASN